MHSKTHEQEAGDIDLVAHWTTKDVTRLKAGALGGAIAGLFALGVGVLLAVVLGSDPWTALKAPAMVVMGPEARDLGFQLPVLIVGFVVFEVFAVVFGMIFAHFARTNSRTALLGVGAAWGAFSWIFIHNLFTPAWREVFVDQVAPGAAFFFWMTYGLGLVVIAPIDRALRK